MGMRPIALYLNFDAIGSKNYVRFIYDGDGSAFGLPAPPGSEAIEILFEDFYTDRGLESKPTPINFRSDYAGFLFLGIPIGGIFAGFDGIKTEAEAMIFGGTAGERYDPCYHSPCDNIDNINYEILDLNADAIAYAALHYAMNTESVNNIRGIRGKSKSEFKVQSTEFSQNQGNWISR